MKALFNTLLSQKFGDIRTRKSCAIGTVSGMAMEIALMGACDGVIACNAKSHTLAA